VIMYIDLELNELCGNFGEALSGSFPATSTGGGTTALRSVGLDDLIRALLVSND
jgi:hypothetical protein